jgi:hypothetical protein
MMCPLAVSSIFLFSVYGIKEIWQRYGGGGKTRASRPYGDAPKREGHRKLPLTRQTCTDDGAGNSGKLSGPVPKENVSDLSVFGSLD